MKTILFIMLFAFSAVSQAEIKPFIGGYGVIQDKGDQAEYVHSNTGIIYGIESKNIGLDIFTTVGGSGLGGIDLRTGFQSGNFSYWIGIGFISESADVSDYTNNWDSKVKRVRDSADFILIQIDHKSGFYTRLTHHKFDDSVFFHETGVTGYNPSGNPVYGIVNSKIKDVSEDRNLLMIGYKYQF